MAEEFNVGDVVQLKSGGPRMTVVDRSHDGDLICQWFDQKEEQQRGVFPPASVGAPESPPGPVRM